MPTNNHINYVEFPAHDLAATKAFFSTVFGWQFQDYGPDYTCVMGQGIDGGFYKSDLKSTYSQGGALVVIYADDLESVEEKVKAAGGKIVQPIFSFPGGRRFHFCEPCGNELAVWSDKGI